MRAPLLSSASVTAAAAAPVVAGGGSGGRSVRDGALADDDALAMRTAGFVEDMGNDSSVQHDVEEVDGDDDDGTCCCGSVCVCGSNTNSGSRCCYALTRACSCTRTRLQYALCYVVHCLRLVWRRCCRQCRVAVACVQRGCCRRHCDSRHNSDEGSRSRADEHARHVDERDNTASSTTPCVVACPDKPDDDDDGGDDAVLPYVMRCGVVLHVDTDGVVRVASDAQTRRLAATADAAAAAVLQRLEQRRRVVRSVDELRRALRRLCAYAPVRIDVDVYTPSGDDDENNDDDDDDGGGGGANVTRVVLRVCGPLRASTLPDVLGVVEDVLLDDCDERHLVVAAVHCVDLSLCEYASAATTTAAAVPTTTAMTSLLSTPVLTLPHTAFAGAVDDADDTDGGGGSSSNQRQVAEAVRALYDECHTRVRILLKNVLTCAACGGGVRSVQLTRCLFAPIDLHTCLPLPLATLRRLVFEQCPLTDAHLDALLRQAVRVTRRGERSVSRHGSTRRHDTQDDNNNEAQDTAVVASAHVGVVALGRLIELQLSGTLTAHALGALLDYLHEETNGAVSLRLLCVPGVLQRAARSHRLAEARPYMRIQAITQ